MRNESKKCQLLCQEETSAQQILKIMAQLEAMEPGFIPLEKARMWGRTQGEKKQKQKEIYIYIYRYLDKFNSLDQAPNLDCSCITTWVQSKILRSHSHIV